MLLNVFSESVTKSYQRKEPARVTAYTIQAQSTGTKHKQLKEKRSMENYVRIYNKYTLPKPKHRNGEFIKSCILYRKSCINTQL